MRRYEFLIDTYRTERFKTLSVWSQVLDTQMGLRLEPRARSPLEHMIHQCISEDAWMNKMLGISTSLPPLPADESRIEFLKHYAACSAERLAGLDSKPDSWFEEPASFFDVTRSRAWILTRRLTHSAHHRGQLTACLRSWGQALYSTYGPTADTGGLPKKGARVVYQFGSVEELLKQESIQGNTPALPGPGKAPPTERPD